MVNTGSQTELFSAPHYIPTCVPKLALYTFCFLQILVHLLYLYICTNCVNFTSKTLNLRNSLIYLN